jgi:hypothetical protein
VALLALGGLGVGISLLVRPPRTLVAAADRLALGLTLAFLLAPAGRFGYLALPVLLAVWARSAAPCPAASRVVARSHTRRRDTPGRPGPPGTAPAQGIPRAAAGPAASGGRTVGPGTEEDF